MKKRTFQEIRKKILQTLEEGPKPITQIANSINADWRTAKRHLEWLEKMENRVKQVKKTKGGIIYKLK
ncbi:MAG: ArsR family transcriptional regulator [Candidatus Aenigmarchaeota archaeon]|nr:ArsR family transcriptional regulator [Candidatus Aenigmarchaeota archaeon]